MAESPAECPSAEELMRLLHSQTGDDTRLESHLSECEQCRSRLDQLSDRNVWEQLLPAHSSSPAEASLATPPMTATAENAAVSVSGRDTKTTVRPPDPEGYQLNGLLGRGGMGVVYEAVQLRLNRRVAVKFLLGDTADPERRLRFRREAEAAGRLDHPHIVRLYEAGESRGVVFAVQELLRGGSLRNRLRDGPLSADAAARIAAAVASALAEAHRQQVIHRDLKPGNILFRDDTDATACLADFGLARLADSDSRISLSNGILGTPAYMSPEMAGGAAGAVRPMADIFSFGVVLYEMLTGINPFAAPTPAAALQRIEEHQPVPPRRLQPGIPRDLETICLHCLNKSPLHRYVDGGALARDLTHFLNREAIEARPPSTPRRLLLLIRRRPLYSLLSGLLFLTVLTITVGGWLLSSRLTEANAELVGLNTSLENNNKELSRQTEFAQAEQRSAEQFSQFVLDDLLALSSAEARLDRRRSSPSAWDEFERDISAADLLRKSAERLGTRDLQKRFPDRPDLQVRILSTVGSALLQSGEYTDAFALLSRAYNQASELEQFPPTQLVDIGLAAAEASIPVLPATGSLKWLELVDGLSRTVFGDRHPTTLATSLLRAEMLYEFDSPAEAADALSHLMERMDDDVADGTVQVRALTLKALCETAMHRYAQGIEAAKAANRLADEHLGKEHPDSLAAAFAAGVCLLKGGNREEAHLQFRQTAETAAAVLGNDHPAAVYYHLRSAAMSGTSFSASQLTKLKDQLARLENEYHPRHPFVLLARGALAEVFSQNGQHTPAVKLFEQIAETKTLIYGPQDHRSLNTRLEVLRLKLNAGETTIAAEGLRELRKEAEHALSDANATRATIDSVYAHSLYKLEEYENAFQVLDPCYQRSVRIFGAGSNSALMPAMLLVAACEKTQRYEREADVAEEILSGFGDRMPETSEITVLLKTRWAFALLQLGRPKSASELLSDLRDVTEERGETDPVRLQVISMLGVALNRIGEKKSARKLLQDVWQTVNNGEPSESNPSIQRVALSVTEELLLMAREAQGQDLIEEWEAARLRWAPAPEAPAVFPATPPASISE